MEGRGAGKLSAIMRMKVEAQNVMAAEDEQYIFIRESSVTRSQNQGISGITACVGRFESDLGRGFRYHGRKF